MSSISTSANNLCSSSQNKSLRMLNRLLNNSSASSSSFADASNENPANNNNAQTSQSTLSVLTSAAASAMSSIQQRMTNAASNNNVTKPSNSSSSSSSTNSSAQNTPNQFRDLTNQSNKTQTPISAQNITDTLLLPSNWANSAVITSGLKLNKKHFDKLNKSSEKLLKYCQSDKMKLISSPPYIIDILPDICQLFNTIHFIYETKLHLLNDLDYFCILIRNCLEKFQELLDLFKVAGKKMYEENSQERQKLVKYTLTFSHILAEMKSIFPKDIYEGQSFRIAKKDASDFWKSNFGDRIIVSWREFELKLNRAHPIANQMEANSLRETIQLTRTKYVSIFEFDIFTRLFQPWNNLLNNWKFLVTEHPGYSAFSTYDEVHKRLQKHIAKPGSYLFRLSCTKLGQWAIGYVTTGNKILQTIPQSLIQALIDGQKQGMYIYPDGRDIKIDVSSAIAVTSASRIQISKEQYDLYCDMGTSFQVCKICSENNKDRKLEPCGHLICSTCLENWQELQSVPSCPFCRCEIKTFEPIIISPFDNRQSSVDSQISGDRLDTIEASEIVENNEDLSYLSVFSPISSNGNGSLKLNSQSSSTKKSKHQTRTNYQTDEDILTDDEPEDCLKHARNRSCRASSKSFSSTQSILVSKEDPAEAKYNLGAILNESSLICLSQDTATDMSKFRLPQAPLFPPPPPPASVLTSPAPETSTSQSQVLSPPLLPPPPPPLSFRKELIVSSQASSRQSLIKLKIENESLFEQLVSQLGNDRVRAACALYLANNDFKQALNLINSTK